MLNFGVTEQTINNIDNSIFLTNQEINQLTVTLKSGTNFAKGTLLGKITASGKYTTWDNRTSGAATDGSQILVGVLLEGVDATSADELGVVGINGVLNLSRLTAVTTVVAGVYNTLGTIIIKEGVA